MPNTRTAIATSTRMNTHHSSITILPEERADGSAGASSVAVVVAPGAGAAGGLGFGLLSFTGARIEPGIDIFERYARLNDRVRSAQLVLTGEGALDAQTLMGKGVGEIANVCQKLRVPCVGLAGIVPEPEKAKEKFLAAHALTPGMTDKESALREPELWLERLAAKVAKEWS